MKINNEITNSQIKLIMADGSLGPLMSYSQAIGHADSLDLDLMEMSIQSGISICKLGDHQKFLYEKKKETKKTKQSVQKEVKFGVGIGGHDFNTKIKTMVRILNSGDTVKASLIFRGREIAHLQNHRVLFDKMIFELREVHKMNVEMTPPTISGKLMTSIFTCK